MYLSEHEMYIVNLYRALNAEDKGEIIGLMEAFIFYEKKVSL